MSAGTLPPYSQEAEEATLGAILVNPDVFVSLLAVLKPDDFFILRHRYIWEAMTRLHERNEPIDLLLLVEALKSDGHLLDIGGPAYLTQLSNCAPNSQHGAIYGTLVEKMAVRRRLMAAADKITALALDTELTVEDITEQIGKMVYAAMTLRSARRVTPFIDLVAQEFQRVQDITENGGTLGLPTGFTELDKLTLGMLPGELILVGGRPGNGKTALALSIAMNVARSGKRVAIFSLEMSKAQLTRRALAMASQVNVHALLKGDLNGGAWKQFVKAAGDISSYQLLIDDWNGLTPQQMQSSIRNLQNGYGKVDLVILDYVQLMTDEDERANRVQQISAISRALKVIANTYNIPVVAISSLSRAVEQRDNKRPVLSDLRDSGQLEFDADKVFFIYRDEVYNETTEFPNQAEIIIAKHRNGPTGTISLYFEKTTTKFCNAAERSVDLSQL